MFLQNFGKDYNWEYSRKKASCKEGNILWQNSIMIAANLT